jgi:copper homeostasis protein
MAMTLVEIASFTPESALMAAMAGADRIELCSGFAEGGLSPSIGAVALVKERVSIPVHVMVRPRVGDFVYHENELQAMALDLSFYRKLGVDGVVLGVLTENGQVNREAIKRLVDVARPMSVTFHRAFDQCVDPLRALDDLIRCGVDRVLTSGGKASVLEGLPILKQWMDYVGNALMILPGGGIKADNVEHIVAHLGVKEIHLSGKMQVNSPMQSTASAVSLCSPNEVSDFQWYECDASQIQAVKNKCL